MKFEEFNIGDLVISREIHSCDVRFVEDSDKEGILLVNGVSDISYGKNQQEDFNRKWRLFVKKENTEKAKFRLYSHTPQVSKENLYLTHNPIADEWYLDSDTWNGPAAKTIFTETELRYINETGFLRDPAN
jgi:hypothetical protein